MYICCTGIGVVLPAFSWADCSRNRPSGRSDSFGCKDALGVLHVLRISSGILSTLCISIQTTTTGHQKFEAILSDKIPSCLLSFWWFIGSLVLQMPLFNVIGICASNRVASDLKSSALRYCCDLKWAQVLQLKVRFGTFLLRWGESSYVVGSPI